MNYFEKQSKATICLIDDEFEEAIYLYQECIEENPDIFLNHFKLGLVFLLLGEVSEAQEIWLSCLAQADIDKISELTEELTTVLEAEAIQRFGNQKIDQAELIIHQILEIDPQNAKAYKNLGNMYLCEDKIDESISCYKQSLLIDPIYIDSHKQLGNAFFRKGDLENAILSYQEALNINSNQIDILFNLGVVLQSHGDLDKAEDLYRKSIKLGNQLDQCFYKLGEVLQLKQDFIYSSLYFGFALYYQRKFEEAIENFEDFLKKTSKHEFVFEALFMCYSQIDNLEKSLQVAHRCIEIYPKNYTLEIKSKLLHPIIYKDKGELDYHRDRIHENMKEILKRNKTDFSQNSQSILSAISSHTNFYLNYQCEDDIDFQRNYGSFVHEVMSTQFPQWHEHRSLMFNKNRKIRIGYISYHFKYHTISKYFLGWLRYSNTEEFEIFTYYTGELCDYVTQEFITRSNHFHHFPNTNDFEEICNQIIKDELDILVYTDIGMQAHSTQLASLRLSPIQCSAWGHPVTTGLPTIDYYLSCSLMEPENAQEYYSEQLVLLPNIGVAYDKPKFPNKRMQREEFGIQPNAIVYLSCQSAFKYLPQYDHIFPQIIEKVPNAQLVFVDTPSQSLASKFKQRIKTAFAQYNLDYNQYCLFLPRQDREGYVNLNLVSDVFLDTIGWSGGNTTLEAIAYGLPVVTLPGKFMRGRQSYGFFKFIEVLDTIASSESSYIEIATRLGLDREWREEILQKIASKQHLLFEDKHCVKALEDFYHSAIKSYPHKFNALNSQSRIDSNK
jgi:protein O-GlcNAc transferase